ncbi:MAG TPA: hypothetical protein DCF33_19550 [Saprospirales bacterium]|nr:hypothetical protein [Saprospirales bacterium]
MLSGAAGAGGKEPGPGESANPTMFVARSSVRAAEITKDSMGILKDIADNIAAVSSAIKNIKEIHAAIKEGKKYLEKTHPEVKKDVAAMCVELQKTCDAIAKASGVITQFQFDATPGSIETQPTRFNDYFIAYKTNHHEAENLIRSLKGHCYVIRDHAEKISSGANKSFWSFFGLHSAEREAALAAMLQRVYNDEMDMHDVVHRMARSMHKAIEDVNAALLTNGLMHADNVPAASARLNEYREHFRQLESLAADTRDKLIETLTELL